MLKSIGSLTRPNGLLQRSYRSHLQNGPKRWAKPEESNTFRRLSMLIGPMLARDNRGKIGGAAGNRTRVQSAYDVRVYPHSSASRTPYI